VSLISRDRGVLKLPSASTLPLSLSNSVRPPVVPSTPHFSYGEGGDVSTFVDRNF